jgi:hypothetical protein
MSYGLVSTPMKFPANNKHGTCEKQGLAKLFVYIYSYLGMDFYLEFLTYECNK